MSIFDVLKLVPVVGEAFKSNSYYKPAQQAASAAMNPNSKKFQQIYNAERQMGQQDLAFQIAELQRQSRKSAEMGRTPLFSPERGGETLFRGLTQGYQNAGDNARRATYDILSGGAKNLASMGQQQQMGGLYKAAAIGSIADAFRPKSEQEKQLEFLKGLFNLG